MFAEFQNDYRMQAKYCFDSSIIRRNLLNSVRTIALGGKLPSG